MKKRTLPILPFIILAVLLCILAMPAFGFADVGNQNDYDYSGDSYDYSSDDSYGGSFGGIVALGDDPLTIALIIIVIIIFGVLRTVARNKKRRTSHTPSRPTPSGSHPQAPPMVRNQASIDIIQTADENFSEQDFLAWVREVFVALNVAWTARDWTAIRVFEDDNLYREHEMQLEDYIRRGQINQIERLGVTATAITDHDMDNTREYVTVKVLAQMVDYVMDERTQAVVSGDKDRVVHMQYTLKFMRTLGTKTLGNLREIGVTNCPNCGAPTKLTAAGQCEFCKTIITSGTYNWVLVSYTGVHAD